MSTDCARAWLARCLVLMTLACVGACASLRGGEVDETVSWPAEKLYAQAKDELNSGNWAAAIKSLEKLEARYPFGRWAQQAQLDTAWAHYREGDAPSALAEIERFIRLHPNHAYMDYALYLRGLINFNENRGIFARLGGQNLSERDLKAAREAFDTFKQLLQRFPESRYAADAELRMRFLLNSMAEGEVLIARYYFRRGAHVAAINRAKGVVEQYQQAPAVEEALYILMRSYEALGLSALRDDTQRVLATNFPNGTLQRRGLRADSGSWWQFWR